MAAASSPVRAVSGHACGNEELKMTEAQEAPSPIRKLLIADDDPGISRFLARQCSKMGFDVQTAKNGLEALIMIRQHRPDVLIIDINMPEVDGLTVCTRMLQSHKRSNGVIVITAGSFSGTVERCKSLGAFHVRKGIDLWNGVRSALTELYSDLAQGEGSDADLADRGATTSSGLVGRWRPGGAIISLQQTQRMWD